MKIILPRSPGNLLSHCKPIFKLLLPLQYLVSFSKMDFFHHRWDPKLFPDLDNGAVEEGDNNKLLLKLPHKDFSQDIYNKYRHQVWGLPFPGSVASRSVFSGRNLLHQWPQECILRWFNQSWKSQYRKGLQFFWLDRTYPIWEPLRNFTDTKHVL